MSEYYEMILLPSRFADTAHMEPETREMQTSINADLVIGVWEGSRKVCIPIYIAPGVQQLGNIRSLVPGGPQEPESTLDTLLAYYPQAFDACPTMATVRRLTLSVSKLDLNIGDSKLHREYWPQLRTEAMPIFRELSFALGPLTWYGPQRFGANRVFPDLAGKSV